jgi:alanyl-tRNA synthetase
MRVIADHVRALTFAIADGAIPSNEGRGYVLRRILRRAARFGRTIGMREPFIFNLVKILVETMSSTFPEIASQQALIERVIKSEEESFNQTLDRGLEIFESVVQGLGISKTFPGDEAFKLYDTFGFPLDLTELLCGERGLHVDSATFQQLMDQQRDRSRESGKMGSAVFGAQPPWLVFRMDTLHWTRLRFIRNRAARLVIQVFWWPATKKFRSAIHSAMAD